MLFYYINKYGAYYKRIYVVHSYLLAISFHCIYLFLNLTRQTWYEIFFSLLSINVNIVFPDCNHTVCTFHISVIHIQQKKNKKKIKQQPVLKTKKKR